MGDRKARVKFKDRTMRYPDGTVRLRNPHIELMDQDILYHLALGSGSHDLVEMFGDVKWRLARRESTINTKIETLTSALIHRTCQSHYNDETAIAAFCSSRHTKAETRHSARLRYINHAGAHLPSFGGAHGFADKIIKMYHKFHHVYRPHAMRAAVARGSFVCMGGTPKRMEQFAYTIMAEIGHKLPCGTTLQDISQFSYRYSMYKVGPVLSISVTKSLIEKGSRKLVSFRENLEQKESGYGGRVDRGCGVEEEVIPPLFLPRGENVCLLLLLRLSGRALARVCVCDCTTACYAHPRMVTAKC
ncbi:Uridine phosphorylase 1 [Eumeta japonica]|uniref:Uridine phosphorylase 1 n=1 Tax=Eumeta variegata TaxID=151549 RepID=A0A4C1W3K1_EUMVA|nr:Uridine phosphorylase 1 [Eumeta japonica]